jgi:hypothetical protein
LTGFSVILSGDKVFLSIVPIINSEILAYKTQMREQAGMDERKIVFYSFPVCQQERNEIWNR